MHGEQILESLKSGDRNAWELLYDLLFKKLYFFSMQLVGEKMEAEDIAIGSLAKFWEKGPHSFETFSEVERFIFLSARNASIDFIRKTRLTKIHHKNLVVTTGDFEESIAELADRALFKAEMLQNLYDQIEKLPKKCRQTFKLVFLEKMPRLDVARKLNITLETVNSHCANAQKRLLQIFSEKELMILLLLLGLCLN